MISIGQIQLHVAVYNIVSVPSRAMTWIQGPIGKSDVLVLAQLPRITLMQIKKSRNFIVLQYYIVLFSMFFTVYVLDDNIARLETIGKNKK